MIRRLLGGLIAVLGAVVLALLIVICWTYELVTGRELWEPVG